MSDISSNTNFIYNSGFNKNIFDASASSLSISPNMYKYGNGSLYITTLSNILYLPSITTITSTVSFSFWFSYSSSVGTQTIFRLSTINNDKVIALSINFGSSYFSITYSVGAITAGTAYIDVSTLPIWNNIVWTINGKSTIIYLNNTLFDTFTLSAALPSSATYTTCYIGANRNYVSGSTYLYTGYINNFMIYNNVLTATDVSNIFINNIT